MTAPSSLSIRRAGRIDLEEVQCISAAAYITAYEAVIGAAPKPAFEDYGPRIERNEVWLLEVEGEAVGLIVLEERADYLLVYSIAVRPERQRHGYGTRLLQFAEAHARAAGRGEVRLYTNRRMERNLALYRNCGFVEIGTHPHPHRAGDVLVDMAKIVK